jgi:SAM-dependent methyltransferase
VDAQKVKERQREIWSGGDYSEISQLLRPVATVLADACAVSAGQEVLDVAAGDGNFAIACAYEGASVVASDFSPTMVERGRARSEAEGYEIEWVEADAEDLPFEDGRFDCAGSVFGAMIAPRPLVVASELFRVVRPGGTVGMTAWIPDAFPSRLFAISRKYAPPPPGAPISDEWAVAETVRERFDGLAGQIEFTHRTLLWEGESPEELTERLGGDAPPAVAARGSLSPEQFDAMSAEMTEAIREAAGDGRIQLECEFLLTVARKRG